MPSQYRVLPAEARRMQALRAKGLSINAVARKTGRSHTTAARYTGGGQPAGRITDEDGRAMRAEYESPDQPSLAALEAKWGWSARAIADAIRRAGGTMRPIGRKRVFPLTDEATLTLLEHGMTRQQIAEHTGFRIGTVDAVLTRARQKRAAGRL